jgi:hypothetical protein
MEDIRQFFECEGCGAEYTLQTDMDIQAEFCPFCSEPNNFENVEYEDIEPEGEGS